MSGEFHSNPCGREEVPQPAHRNLETIAMYQKALGKVPGELLGETGLQGRVLQVGSGWWYTKKAWGKRCVGDK